MVKRAYLKIQSGEESWGDLQLILYNDTVPKTVDNFVHYLLEDKQQQQQQQNTGVGYSNTSFHRVMKGFMAQGGDFLNNDGTGSISIYGPSFADENFIHPHDRRGTLSMANHGKDTNGMQFFITFQPTPHLNNKHVVFGHVDLTLLESRSVLDAMENARTDRNDRPLQPLTIVKCGVLETENLHPEAALEADNNEIDLEDPEDMLSTSQGKSNTLDGKQIYEKEVMEEEEELPPPETKAEALRQRMRKLKMKMNQARQLNKQQVLQEGERLGSIEGAAKTRKRQQIQDKKAKEAEWKARNSKALSIAAVSGLDGKYLVEQADSSLRKTFRKEEKAVANQFDINDYYNPEGMHRKYERDLKSLPFAAAPLSRDTIDTVSTFDPTMNHSDEKREREGARNLANELKRRIEKQKNKRNRVELEGEDVSYINQRNKKFNQKIARNYDKHTAEIRQNLERGTAL